MTMTKSRTQDSTPAGSSTALRPTMGTGGILLVIKGYRSNTIKTIEFGPCGAPRPNRAEVTLNLFKKQAGITTVSLRNHAILDSIFRATTD